MLPNVTDPVEFGAPFDDYDSDGPINPSTEQTASQYNKHAIDVAAITHVSPRAIVHVTYSGSTPSVTAYDSVWGNDPTVYPTVTDNGTGDVTLTWDPAGYPDLHPTPASRVTRAPNFRFAHAQQAQVIANIAVANLTANCCLIATNAVRVGTLSTAGSLADIDFMVFLY